MSQSPSSRTSLSPEHPYAQAAAQLNRLVRSGRSFSGHERNCCYLNLAGQRFANVSAVSGVDFAEDGRAVAQGDWDFDGDVDYWIANRTAPQLRFLRNDFAERANHFIAFRLVGTELNRDAIGATVVLEATDSTNADPVTLRRGLRAGEGYLAQSSKWLHFGLGPRSTIRNLQVRWPNGARESFAVPAQVDQFFQLVEGSGVLQAVEVSKVPAAIPNVPRLPTRDHLATQNLLTQPVPLPSLPLTRLDGTSADATNTAGRPRVVNLWATWCAECVVELEEWNRNANEFSAHGIDVQLVSVDALDAAASDGPDTARGRVQQWVERLGCRFDVSLATNSLMNAIQSVHDEVYDHRLPLPVPTTLLLDGAGRLAAIYKGPVDVNRLVQDVRHLALPVEQREAAALPFPGHWIGRPGASRLSRIVARLWDDGLEDVAIDYAKRLTPTESDHEAESDHEPALDQEAALAAYIVFERLKGAGRIAEATAVLQRQLLESPNDPESCFRLGTLLFQHGKVEEAVAYLQRAVQYSPTARADVHTNLGIALRRSGDLGTAVPHLLRSLEIDPEIAETYSNLGLAYAAARRFTDAEVAFHRAVELQPEVVEHYVNLATAYLSQNQPRAAIAPLRAAIDRDANAIVARIYLAEALTQLNEPNAAIEQFLKVVDAKPNADRIWLRIAQLNEQLGQRRDALDAYRRVTRSMPNDARLQSRIAWILCTAAEPELRDGAQALALATRCAAQTRRQEVDVLDTLAAAYAELKQFDKAVATAQEGLDLIDDASHATSGQLQQRRAAVARRLEGYRKQVPFREQ